MFKFTHRNPEMQIDKQHTALVLADMQNEFLEEKTGTYYELIADALKKRNVIANLEELLKTAQELGYYVIHSPIGTIRRTSSGTCLPEQSRITSLALVSADARILWISKAFMVLELTTTNPSRNI